MCAGARINRQAKRLVLLLAALIALSACRSLRPGGVLAPALRLGADTSTHRLAESLLNTYESQHPGTLVTLQTGSRQSTLAALEAGEIDAALLLHPLEGAALFQTPVGSDLLVVITHPDVPLTSLTRRDVRALFSGQVTAWPSGGAGAGTPVQVIVREQDSSARLAFEALLMPGQTVTPSARLSFDDGQMLDLVASTPGAAGFVPFSVLGDAPARVMAYEDIPPTPENARSRAYRLVTPVVLVATGEPSGGPRAFLDWVLEDEGQAVVRRHLLGVGD